MKNTKFFVSTLIAAAAMTSLSYAGEYNVTGTVTNSTEVAEGVSISSLTNADTITFDGATGYLPGWNGDSFAANIVLVSDGFTWDNGSSTSDTTITFTGSLSGSGTFQKKTKDNNKRQCFVFAGDVSGFSGDFVRAESEGTTTGTLTFGNGGQAVTGNYDNGDAKSVSGTGTISWAGKEVFFNYNNTNPVVVGNSSITAGTLTFQGGASYSVSSNVTAGTLTLSAGTLTLDGNTTVSSALSVASGTTLTNTGTLNLTGGESTINGTYSGTGTFNINDGAVLVMVGNDSSANQTAGEITINGGGTVKITGHDLMGWGGSANTAFVLAGASSEKVATLCVAENNGQILTLSRSVEMRGNAVLSSENGSGFNTYGGSLSISGTNNIVSSKILLRNAFEVSVAEAGEAEISGNISEHGDGSNGFTKSGLGKLTLSGDNIYGCGLTVGAGTLAISGRADDVDSITVAENAILDLSGATVSLTSAISNAGTVEVSSGTVFKLLSSNSTDGTYSVINNSGTGSITNWDSTTLGTSNFVIDGDVVSVRSSVDFSAAGVVTITGGAISLNWVGTDGTGTWNTASTNTPWADSESNAQFFADKDSVTFNTSGASVTVDGTVKPNAMTVSANTTFSGSGEIILAAPGNLTIDSGAKLSLGSGVTLDLGSSTGALDLSLVVGAGTVKYTHTKGEGGSSGLVTAADFTGLVDYVGNLNWSDSYNDGQVTIGNNGMTLRLSARSGEVDGIWGRSDKTFTNAIEFGSDYKIYLGSANLTLAGAVAAKGKALTLEGANTLKISGNATIGKLLGGTTNVTDGGVLTIGDEIENGNTSLISGTVNVLGGGTLKLAGHDALGHSNRGASGTVIAQGDSSDKTATILFADTGKLTLSKEIQLKGNTVVKNADGNTNAIKAFGGQFTATGTNNTISTAFDMSQGKVDFSVDQGGELTVDGVISGGNSWEKLGDGALTLKGANISYSGTINVSAGTLVAAHVSALGNGQVSVAADAKLGIVAGTTVTGVTGGIALSDGAKLVIDLSSMVGETETFTLDLITGTTITFGETSLASNSSNVADTWYELSGWDKDGWASTLNYDSASQTLSLTMTIPEPSAFGLLAGVGALALVVSRRRRVKKA